MQGIKDFDLTASENYTCYRLRFQVPFIMYGDGLVRLNVYSFKAWGHWRAAINSHTLEEKFATKEDAAKAVIKALKQPVKILRSIKVTELVPEMVEQC